MTGLKNKFTLKIIFSYLVLGILAFIVGRFLFLEVKNFSEENVNTQENKKIIETGTLINLLYKTDGFTRLALLTENDDDFKEYMMRNDSLFSKIEEIKILTTDVFQQKQLDSIKYLLEEKNQNIDQLRILRLTNQKETSLDDIMKEVRKLEASVGLASVESMVREPWKLTPNERRIWQSYADYLNSDRMRDTSTVKSKVVDSMLIASRYIVSEAKKENSRIRQSLIQKENELIRNDLNISEKLREIISSFDAEIARKNNLENEQRAATLNRATQVLRYAAILGVVVVLLFSYYILTDFFRAERFKKNLESSKLYTERLLKNREQLISTVSHDLKTPLNTISGYSQLFGNTVLSKKQKYYLSQINSSSDFISHLVNDLLDFSKLEIGKLALESVPFSLESVIKEVGNNFKQVYSEKEIVLILEISPSLKNRLFENDPLRIKQILNNLVGNAFKFTSEGYVKIQAKEIESENQISTVEIIISDTGIGISKEKQKDIFKEFTQAENDIAHRFGGSGLGLTISKKLTSLLNGSLEVESELGAGSSFIFTIPLKHSKKKFVQSESSSDVGRLTGLILDDDPTMGKLLEELFKQMDIRTFSFTDYQELKKYITKEKIDFDYVLTDIQMPIINGFEVLEKLKSGDLPVYKNQKIIAMTGSQEHPDSFFIERGFSNVIRKPFFKAKLLNLIKSLFPDQIPNQEIITSEKTEDVSSKNKLFDLSLLKSFVETPKAFEEVLRSFDHQTNKDLDDLKVAVSLHNLEKVKLISHRMLTMFRQLQAVEVIPILEKFESLSGKNMDQNSLKKDFELLFNKIKSLQERLLLEIA